MIYGYARVSTGSQSEAAQVAALRKHGAVKVFRKVAQDDKTDRAQLRRLLNQLAPDDVVTVTRIDRLARSTFDLFAIVKRIADAKAQFRYWSNRGPTPAPGG
jgi:DNA invertase Pin-like site-specific DNA recombinase